MTDDDTPQADKRLNKQLAFLLGVSRREADNLISDGKVTINSSPAVLGARVTQGDVLAVDGKIIPNKDEFTYLLFNKPVGYVCSRASQGDAPTIYSLLPKKYQALKTVGRLDKDSSGLLLLTDDGDFAYQMTHPKFHKVKIYEVALDEPLEPLHQQMISDHGIALDDGISKFELERLDESRSHWRITMHEGRNRQIRRTFIALGYRVDRLHRTQFGAYSINDLVSGAIIAIENR